MRTAIDQVRLCLETHKSSLTLVLLFAALFPPIGCIPGSPAFGTLPPSPTTSESVYDAVAQSAVLGTPRFQQFIAQVVEPGEAAAARATEEDPFEPNPERERLIDDDSLVETEDEEDAPRLGFPSQEE